MIYDKEHRNVNFDEFLTPQGLVNRVVELVGRHTFTDREFMVLDPGANVGQWGTSLKEKYPHAWIEGVEGYGIGESITFKFPKEAFEEAKIEDKINFNGFIVVNGYCKNKQTWQDNSRVKRVLIAHNGRPLYEAKFHNSMNIQRVYFDNIYLKPGDTVKVTILEVYRGDKYRDTAISELVPTGAH